MIELSRVTHTFGKKTVIEDVDLSVRKGEVFGLLGPSGSGKTTLVRIMTGMIEPSEGTVWLREQQMPKRVLMKRFGYMAQEHALYQELTAKENLDFFASFYLRKKKKERIDYCLQLTKLTEDKDRIVSTFSGGMKRRLSLAIALVHDPEILILDEPTVGLDPVLRHEIWEEFHRLKNEGTTIFVTTHVMDEAEKCDRLAMLRDGRMIASGSPSEWKEELHVESIEDVFLHYGRRKV
ncbi:ABC transporter ATP-binding protein [Salimicrobium halophilum]|uniref:ABC-2 type transport system ATP-binding protein n=1 Tax=Salimicrobium halophilum TaxID=86666 RepID=A0A1G8TVU8_9BACI|nr:ABC transporter ATP-binding protein [Salimicrobium halophilum]SDJ45619.1 ABC-2 type transport system ATP-binding protein [Salimicrobium halophilum]